MNLNKGRPSSDQSALLQDEQTRTSTVNGDTAPSTTKSTHECPLPLETPLHALFRHSFESPNATALITEDDEKWSYSRLANEVSNLSNGLLNAGICPGDRLVLSVKPSPVFTVFMYAAMMTGAIVVPLKLELTARELNEFFDRLRPALYIHDAELNEGIGRLDLGQARVFSTLDDGPDSWRNLISADLSVKPAMPVDPDATFLLLCTSGTTGMPKLVAYSQRIIANIFEGGAYHDNPELCAIAATEVAHISGIWTMLASITSGCRQVLINHITAAKLLDKIEQYKCTHLFVPLFLIIPMVETQRRRKRNISSLRSCRTGGDACKPHMAEAYANTFNLPLENAYGMTECIGCTLSGADYSTIRGKPGRTKLLDEHGQETGDGGVGELYVSGPNVSQGYWVGPGEITDITDNGWLATGDLMKQEANGDYRLIGRCKDMIVVKGANISPLEVENQLIQFPAIIDANVIGIPDDITGQQVLALVKLSETVASEVILDWLAERIAAYKLPQRIIVVTDIPRNAMGKADRKAVESLVLESL